jgi:hypothetical protein
LHTAQKSVEAAEGAIYLAAGELPEKGTIYCTGVKIVTGFYEKFDDAELANAEVKWPTISNLPFPFNKVYKADGKALSYLRDNVKEAYALIEKALTSTPKKPAFSLLEEKESNND